MIHHFKSLFNHLLWVYFACYFLWCLLTILSEEIQPTKVTKFACTKPDFFQSETSKPLYQSISCFHSANSSGSVVQSVCVNDTGYWKWLCCICWTEGGFVWLRGLLGATCATLRHCWLRLPHLSCLHSYLNWQPWSRVTLRRLMSADWWTHPQLS